jgi:hypothetical protein
LIGIFFTGCTSTQTVRYQTKEKQFWKKNGASYQKAQLDYKVCQAKVSATEVRETRRGGLVEACMQLNDYKWSKYIY